MQNKVINIEPIALGTTLTTNLLNSAITSLSGPIGFTPTQPYLLITHARVVNKTATAATVSLWKGATGANTAGTEWWFNNVLVPANGFLEAYGKAKFESGDFLVGGASLASTLTLIVEGEIGFM